MYLAGQPDRFSSVKEVSEIYGISRNHMVKVAHLLAMLGYIDSTKGKGGGIRLKRELNSIRLGRLISELEPNLNLVECFDKDSNSCKITNSCQLKHILFDARTHFLEYLNQFTLEDIASASFSALK